MSGYDPDQTSPAPRSAGLRNQCRWAEAIRLGGALTVCSAGEITNVTQAFQPSGRFWLANSQ